jgi:hypothetical protein
MENQTRSLNELWYETEEKINHGVRAITSEQRVDEECATINEEKNCARARAIHIQNRSRAAKLTGMNE